MASFDPRYYGIPPTQQIMTENRYPYTATAGQTAFSAEYPIGYVDVYYNGSHLDPRTAFTATDGHTVTLTTAADSGASVIIISRPQVATQDIYSKAQSDALASNFYGVATGTGDAMVVSTNPSFTSFFDGMEIRVRAVAANTTTAPTIAINGLPAKTILRNPQTILSAGDYSANDEITLRYVVAIDKLVLVLGSRSASIGGAFKNLKLSATGTNSHVSVTVDEIVVENASASYLTLRTVSLDINSTTVGANGLDTGALAASTWYSVWVISNGTTTAGLLSLSATMPTLPAGYTFMARVGWIRTDGTANKYPLSFQQYGRKVQYKVAASSNVASLPPMAIGAAGAANTTSAPTWVAIATGNFVPSTAGAITIYAANNYNNGSLSVICAAQNNAYSGAATANPPPVHNSTGAAMVLNSTLTLESSNIYWASSAAGGAVLAAGWEDNL